MYFILFLLYPPYVKKEDVKEFIKGKRKAVAFMMLLLVMVVGSIQFVISPKILDLYKELNVPVPLITQLNPFIITSMIIIYIALSIRLLFTQPNYEKIDKILSKYKDGEMIKTREVMNFKYEVFAFIILVISVVYLIVSTITPIYNLTNKY